MKAKLWISLVVVLLGFGMEVSAAGKKIVLVAGRPSHGTGSHEFNAGIQLLHQCMEKVPALSATYYLSGWPEDKKAFDGADAIVLYMDGGSGHPAVERENLEQLSALMKKGVGLACLHYAVEVPKENGGPQFLEWIGGYFETHWSVNPHWTADFKVLPPHPITRGVKPFKVNDEWYYHMRFPEGMKGVTPILTAVPPEETRSQKDGPHSGNPTVRARKGMPEHVAWAFERPDGGRGFGFTGGHLHRNWGHDDLRKLVLNAILWTAKADVPAQGVASVVTEADLKKNLDPKTK
jgi:type 1 glutamine amidotransferase